MLGLLDSLRDEAPAVPSLLRVRAEAGSLTALLLAAWQGARVLAVPVVATVRDEHAHQPTAWPPCPAGGACGWRKGCATRPHTRVVGTRRWPRRGGRGPPGCALPQVAPWEEALGGRPP